MVDVEGTGQAAQFTFKGVAKPEAVPDAPPAPVKSKAAAAGTDALRSNE
jgi:hypothetical protein